MNQVQEELMKPDVQDALLSLLQQLPKLTTAIESAEKGISFLNEVVHDKESVAALTNGASEHLAGLLVDGETVRSLLTLLEKLPKLVEIIGVLEQVYDLAQSFLGDPQSVQQLSDSVRSYVNPVREKVELGLSMIEESNRRSKQAQETISIFGMMKLLKDPQVQRGLQFARALLTVLGERPTRQG